MYKADCQKDIQKHIDDMKALKPIFWQNTRLLPTDAALGEISCTIEDVEDAEKRLHRFSKYIAEVFSETTASNGLIESPLVECISLYKDLLEYFDFGTQNKLLVKLDSHLPAAGSVKARGGVYEVLKHAEKLAIDNNLLTYQDDYSVLAEDRFKKFFGGYSIAVGSTGNLGLSIGISGAALGFNVFVHMSRDAKEWKKQLLREKGVTVIEYDDDYSAAVKQGRQQAEHDPKMYFIDDENSVDLFLGYAVAAFRLKKQLDEMGYTFDENYKLRVYLPCGIGGAPGGITFGLKLVFKDSVECYLAEPTHAPCMTLGLITGEHDNISVYDIGIDSKTEADGLAVARPSRFVGKTIDNLLSGCYTVTDENMYRMLYLLSKNEGINVEPSAAAALLGPIMTPQSDNCLHLAWLTGGSMVPEDMMKDFILKGKRLLNKFK